MSSLPRPLETPSAYMGVYPRSSATQSCTNEVLGFRGAQLLSHLQARDADGLVITGSETDVCVLGTVLTASSLYETRFVVLPTKVRFSEQIGTANADEIIDAWS